MILSINSLDEFNNLLCNNLTLLYCFPDKTDIVFYEIIEILSTVHKNNLKCYSLKLNNQNQIIKIFKNKKLINNINKNNLNLLNKLIIKNL